LTGAVIGLTSTNILSVANNRTISFANLTFADLVGWNYADAALGTYTLINGGSSVSFGSTSAISAATAYDFGNGKKGYFREGSLQVVIIPETSATLLLGIGALGFALRRRRA
jgi:MprA protease rhombosortase-interaction domain-containing protein